MQNLQRPTNRGGISVRLVKLFVQIGSALMALPTLLAAADHGANLHSNEQLVLAAERGYLDDVKRLLNSGISVNEKDHSGLTPWQAARIYGRKGVADFLGGPFLRGGIAFVATVVFAFPPPNMSGSSFAINN